MQFSSVVFFFASPEEEAFYLLSEWPSEDLARLLGMDPVRMPAEVLDSAFYRKTARKLLSLRGDVAYQGWSFNAH